MHRPYNDLNTYLRDRFGCRVQKITIDAGLTCPNRDGNLSFKGCLYCNAKGSGTGAWLKGRTVTDQLLEGKIRLSRRYKARKFIAYFQSYTNTYAPLTQLEGLYREALAVEDVVGLAIGTRPDCVDEPVLALLEELAQSHMIWIEYGLQSANDATLRLIQRGHDFRCFAKAVEATRGRGILICAHVILGLPREDRAQMIATAKALADLGVDGVKIHLLYVIKGTKLETWYRRGTYRCLDQSSYVDLVCEFMEYLPPGMVIQRLTGDPHAEELLAPRWALNKAETLQLIRTTLAQRDAWQGKRMGAAMPP